MERAFVYGDDCASGCRRAYHKRLPNMIRLAVFLSLLIITQADAHGFAESFGSRSAWTSDPWVLLPLYLLAISYLIGTTRLMRRGGCGHCTTSRLACFWIGWTVLALALLSPLHLLSEQLLSAHMIEHELIMAIAAPLLVLSRPIGPLLWAFPDKWRRPMALTWLAPFTTLLAWLTIPVVATALHSAVIWAWHAPVLFDAALAHPWLHILQHISFLVSAVLFWYAIRSAPRDRLGLSALHLFMTMIAMTALGALIALSPQVLYAAYHGHAEMLGWTSLEDQQLAGVIMWVPGCAIYAAAALALLGQWIAAGASPAPTLAASREAPI
jgi:cytochrome c oxidase assembly factor CtaG